MAHKLDIFKTLSAIDRHDLDFLRRVSEDEAKSFAPPVVLRWASSSDNRTAEYLCDINEVANVHHYALYQHPELQYRLMASCGKGRSERHNWIPSGKTSQLEARRKFVQQYYPYANTQECDIIISKLTGEVLDEFLLGTGLQNDEIKRVRKLF